MAYTFNRPNEDKKEKGDIKKIDSKEEIRMVVVIVSNKVVMQIRVKWVSLVVLCM